MTSLESLKTTPISWTVDKLYREHKDLSHMPAIKHGVENEAKALEDLSALLQLPVQPCGLFVHRDYPFLGASPDGLVFKDSQLVTVEVKCPYVLRDHKPTDVEKLTKQQKRNFFCVKHLSPSVSP